MGEKVEGNPLPFLFLHFLILLEVCFVIIIKQTQIQQSTSQELQHLRDRIPERRRYNVSDDELIDKIKRGDETAAEELIDRYYAAILRYCGWHCSNREKAEDLTQETFLKLFRSLPRYKGRNRFKSYLYTIANRLCIDESRKMSFYSLEDAEEIADGQNEIAQAEHREEISRLLSVLSDVQREAVLLHFGQELGFAQIAEVMGGSRRTAQSRVRNALRLMRKECGDER